MLRVSPFFSPFVFVYLLVFLFVIVAAVVIVILFVLSGKSGSRDLLPNRWCGFTNLGTDNLVAEGERYYIASRFLKGNPDLWMYAAIFDNYREACYVMEAIKRERLCELRVTVPILKFRAHFFK